LLFTLMNRDSRGTVICLLIRRFVPGPRGWLSGFPMVNFCSQVIAAITTRAIGYCSVFVTNSETCLVCV
jgi:hypothetical protein